MSFAEQAAAAHGKKVEISGATFIIGDLMDKMGKLRDGTEVNYVSLASEDGSEVRELHPRKAQALFTTGEADGIKMLIEVEAAEDKLTPTEVVCHPTETATTETATTEAASTEAAATETPAADAGATTEAAVEKKVSKKSLCVAIYNDGVAKNQSRKDIIARFAAEAGVTSGPGAATYYQNCKSGAWK